MSDPWGVFPPRNLGRLSEEWGREVEFRLIRLRRAVSSTSSFLKGQNRSAASSTASLARRFQTIEDAAEELERNLNAVPVIRQDSTYTSGFSVPTSWTTRATASLTVPDGKTRANLVALSQSRVWDVGQAAPPTASLIWPFDPNTTVTSEYGPRDLTGNFHEGIDFGMGAAVNGAAIIAAGDGVVHVNQTGFMGYGTAIMINHGQLSNNFTVYTLYAHRQTVEGPGVGQSVSQGTVIGHIGSTGNVTGPHLHYEIHMVPPGGSLTWDYLNPSYSSPRTTVNPRDFMASSNNQPGEATYSVVEARMLLGGAASPVYVPDRAMRPEEAIFTNSWGRTMDVTPGQVLRAEMQYLSRGSNIVADSRSYSGITLRGVFS